MIFWLIDLESGVTLGVYRLPDSLSGGFQGGFSVFSMSNKFLLFAGLGAYMLDLKPGSSGTHGLWELPSGAFKTQIKEELPLFIALTSTIDSRYVAAATTESMRVFDTVRGRIRGYHKGKLKGYPGTWQIFKRKAEFSVQNQAK